MSQHTAAPAARHRENIPHDLTLLDGFDPEYLDVEAAEVEDVELMTDAERQALNARMADWYFG